MPKELNWIDSLVNECQHVETPISWLWFSFLTCISAASGNNYFLRSLKGDFIYKPNLYVMLLGESGLGKGFGINRAKLLISRSNVTRVIAGRSSIQAIVKELATTRTRENKELITDSRGFIVNGELSTAIIADPDALTILTDLYDGHYNPEWTNLLKGDGAEKLKNPYITALFGSSPSHFYDSVPQVNIEGGYIGRNLIIYEEKRSKDVDLLDELSDNDIKESETEGDKFDKYLAPKYIPHLEKIAKMSGQLKPDDDARKFFNTWRKEWRKTQQPDKTGFLNRVPDHALKIAMCLSLSEYEFDGYIREWHFKEAIEKVIGLIYASEKTSRGSGLDPLAAQTKFVLDVLVSSENQESIRKVLLKKCYGNCDAPTLDRILDNLQEMQWVNRVKIGVGKNMDYLVKLSGEPLESYKKYLDSKKKDK